MIKVGIVGYGNLGRGVEIALKGHLDFELVCVFTRRLPELLETVYPETKKDTMDNILKYCGKIDVMILCGGSKSDLPVQTPYIAEYFNIIDSIDTHNLINEHFDKVNDILLKNNRVGIIAAGWDPGLFSLNRLLFSSVLPKSVNYTFWGDGVSQGHSDAVRRIAGVKMAVQYTIPIKETLDEIRSGSTKDYLISEKHKRVCYVVSEDDKLNRGICDAIKSMPDYFADYHTEVYFITEEELLTKHNKMPHGGLVIQNGFTGIDSNNIQNMEFSVKLDSNPEFTASILVCYARAVYKMACLGQYGCKTVFDIPLSYLSNKNDNELRKELL